MYIAACKLVLEYISLILFMYDNCVNEKYYICKLPVKSYMPILAFKMYIFVVRRYVKIIKQLVVYLNVL
jgi:hypothetical protein